MIPADTLAYSSPQSTACVWPATHEAMNEDLLIRYLQLQDRKAITILYDNYSPALYGVILRIVKSEVIAEDVLQECFVKIWLNFPFYNPAKGRLFTWLVTIARHMAIDTIRSGSYLNHFKTQPIEKSGLKEKPDTTGVRPDDIGIRELTNNLSSEHKKIIDLMYFAGYTQSEIAQEFDIPLGTVKTRARHAMQILRKLLVKPEADAF